MIDGNFNTFASTYVYTVIWLIIVNPNLILSVNKNSFTNTSRSQIWWFMLDYLHIIVVGNDIDYRRFNHFL